jgi:hypothetical protein
MYKVLVAKPEGKRPLVRPRHRWEDWIRMCVREIGWGMWSGCSLLRIRTCGGSCEGGDEPSSSGATDLVG